MLAAGQVIDGRYVVQRPLGTGGQGEVYEVLDTHEHDVVALKLLTNLPAGGPWTEAQILRRLVDAHILPIRNADLASGHPYLVTDLAQHGNLGDRVTAAGPRGVPVDDVVRWTQQACHGVARAHDLGLIHNDLKPANLFLNAQGECLVADFGMAVLLPAGALQVFPPGATAETAAPEIAQAWGTPTASASFRSDVYSLGASAYWLLAGKTAHDFTGVTDLVAKMAIVSSQIPERLHSVAPHVPIFIARTVERAMARLPAGRFASVGDFASALARRPAVMRRWRRVDLHPHHLGCWVGDRIGTGGYMTCLEQGGRASVCTITTTHAASGHRVTRGCRTAPMRNWAQAVRSVIRDLD